MSYTVFPSELTHTNPRKPRKILPRWSPIRTTPRSSRSTRGINGSPGPSVSNWSSTVVEYSTERPGWYGSATSVGVTMVLIGRVRCSIAGKPNLESVWDGVFLPRRSSPAFWRLVGGPVENLGYQPATRSSPTRDKTFGVAVVFGRAAVPDPPRIERQGDRDAVRYI